MNKFLLAVSFVFALLGAKAQPAGDTFPDFTYTDLDGNTHHLQSYLDEGKTVIIDVFATWCINCQNSVPGFEALYNSHGQAGDQSMVLLSFERDPNTSNEASYIQQHNVESPVITEATEEIMNSWNITYQPRYFVICPDGTFDDPFIGPIGSNPQPLIDQADACPGIVDNLTELSSEDFSITAVEENRLTYSSAQERLQFRLLDLTGSTVFSGLLTDEQGEIDISSLHTGIYLISVYNDASMLTLRFLKQ